MRHKRSNSPQSLFVNFLFFVFFAPRRVTIHNSQYFLAFYSAHTRALTFENLCRRVVCEHTRALNIENSCGSEARKA
jgi:hypothetical protein